MGVVAAALLFVAYSIYLDVEATGTNVMTYLSARPEGFRTAKIDNRSHNF